MKLLNFTLLLTLLLCSLPARSQTRPDYDKYMKEASSSALLYRGEQAIKYPYTYIGTQYAIDATFTPGWVIFNGKLYTNIKLNLDSHFDDLYLLRTDGILVTKLKKELVQSFGWGNLIFEKLSDNKYYLIIYDGDIKAYKHIRKLYDERIPQTYASGTPALERTFYAVYDYSMLKDGKLYSIDRKNDFLGHFEPEVRRAAKKQKAVRPLTYSREKDQYIQAVLTYVESL